MRQLFVILLFLFLLSEVRSQADSTYYLDSIEIDGIHSNIPLIFYNHMNNSSITVRSSHPGPSFEFSFYKFAFNKFTSELSIMGSVKDPNSKMPISNLKFFFGKLNKDSVEMKKEIGSLKYSTFYIHEIVSQEDYIFFYRYDYINDDDDFILSPLEIFKLSLLWEYSR